MCGTSVGLCPLGWLEAALLSEYLLSGWIPQDPAEIPSTQRLSTPRSSP